MPPLPPAPGVTRAVLGFSYAQQFCANVLHFIDSAGVQSPDPETLAERLVAWYAANLQSRVPNTLSLTSVTTTPLDAGGPPALVFATGLPLTGSGANPQLPNSITPVMTLRTAIRGRSFRGRIYHLGCTENDVNGNSFAGTILENWRAAYALLINLAGAGGEPIYKISVLSYYSAGAIRPTGIATPVTSVTADGTVDTQRRRLPGR